MQVKVDQQNRNKNAPLLSNKNNTKIVKNQRCPNDYVQITL